MNCGGLKLNVKRTKYMAIGDTARDLQLEDGKGRVFKSKNCIKTEFHRNGLSATIGSNFQEGQN